MPALDSMYTTYAHKKNQKPQAAPSPSPFMTFGLEMKEILWPQVHVGAGS